MAIWLSLMKKHVCEKDESCLRLGNVEVSSDESVVKKCVDPLRGKEETATGCEKGMYLLDLV